jgi:L-lactate dehydrogenase
LAKGWKIDAQSVSGYVIGEHGDSSVALWSSVRIGGVPLLQSLDDPPSPVLQAMHREVIESAGDVIRKKGYTNWAVGLTGAYIANAVVDDVRQIMPLSTCVRGLYGIEEDVFLSVPCSVGSWGVRRVIDVPLTKYEVEGFLRSAETVWDVQKAVWDDL